MNGNRFRQLALALPEAVEGAHRGHPDFRVSRKVFATLNADESAGHVKCDPVNLELLVRANPVVFRDAWGGRWLGIDLSQVDEGEVLELLEDAWLSVTRKALAASYERRGSERWQRRDL
jgi:hypothetical protein